MESSLQVEDGRGEGKTVKANQPTVLGLLIVGEDDQRASLLYDALQSAFMFEDGELIMRPQRCLPLHPEFDRFAASCLFILIIEENGEVPAELHRLFDGCHTHLPNVPFIWVRSVDEPLPFELPAGSTLIRYERENRFDAIVDALEPLCFSRFTDEIDLEDGDNFLATVAADIAWYDDDWEAWGEEDR